MIFDFARKNPGMTRILTGHALMFEEAKLQARVAQFFDRLEMKFFNILQMRKRRENRSFSVDERTIATYLVTLCVGAVYALCTYQLPPYAESGVRTTMALN